MVPIIQREVDTFRCISPNEVPNQIDNLPKKYSLQNKSNIIFLSKGCLPIECSYHQFHVTVFSTINNINLSNYQPHTYKPVIHEKSC